MPDNSDSRVPDSVSPEQLKQLLGKLSPEMPVSKVIPELVFRDKKTDSGGLCDLQFAIIQLVEKSDGGVEYHQLLTASLYLFERCVFYLKDSISEARATYKESDRESVLAELESFSTVFQALLSQFQDVHMGMSAAATIDRMQALHKVLGDFTDQETYRSHLLLSQSLIDSMGLDRTAITKFVRDSSL
tara:strand:- start:5093 stop:5656 length:564 start_codon:yes stop_codon:yes gene_type:complete